MKRLIQLLCVLGLLGAFAGASAAQTSTSKTPAKTSTKAKASKKAPKASAAKPRTKKAATQCRTLKLKNGKTRRLCKSEARTDQVLSSPISNNALSKSAPPDNGPEVKVRTAPDRAYAVDGETFFYQGRKYRVAGMGAADSSDMAKLRLQKSLESGVLSIDPLSTDDAGVTTAVVRVDSRNLADRVR